MVLVVSGVIFGTAFVYIGRIICADGKNVSPVFDLFNIIDFFAVNSDGGLGYNLEFVDPPGFNGAKNTAGYHYIFMFADDLHE